jgi:hypothetical protein
MIASHHRIVEKSQRFKTLCASSPQIIFACRARAIARCWPRKKVVSESPLFFPVTAFLGSA